jgi:WD40 repeat protein
MAIGIPTPSVLPGVLRRRTAAVAIAATVAASMLIGTASRVASQDNSLRPPGGYQLPPHGQPLAAMAFSPDGKRLATVSGLVHQKDTIPLLAFAELFGQIKIWDVNSARVLLALPNYEGARAIAFSPDGNLLLTGMLSGDLRLLDASNGAKRAQVHAHDAWVNGVAFSPDGTMVASGGQEGLVKLWNVPGLRELKELRGHAFDACSLAFFHHGSFLASGSGDKTARIWNVQTGAATRTLPEHPQGISALAVSPDDHILATAGGDNIVRLFSTATGKEQSALHGRDHSLVAVAFSPDGKLLAGGTRKGSILLWDVTTRNLLATLEKHAAIVQALAFSPDGTCLASASNDATVKIWDVAARKDVATLLNPWTDAQLSRARTGLPQFNGSNGGSIGETNKPMSKLWMLGVLVAGLMLLYLLFWLYLRWSRRKADKVSSAGEAA